MVLHGKNTFKNNFNSQPLKGADFSHCRVINCSNISTHSLSRRLTCRFNVIHCIYCISTHSLSRRLTTFLMVLPFYDVISTHSLSRRLTFCYFHFFSLQPISTHSLSRRLTDFHCECRRSRSISTHSLSRRLTAILFNKNCFVQLIFITLYQSPPQPLLLPSFFTLFSYFQQEYQVRISRGLGGGLGFAL